MTANAPYLLLTFALLLAPGAPAEEQDTADRALLQKAEVGSDGPALVAFLRRQALTPEESAELEKLVRQLGSEDFAEREKATDALSARGWPALPFVSRVRDSKDPEVALRAERCLLAIHQNHDATLPGAALRLLTRHPPGGATAVLLLYAPWVADGDEDQYLTALVAAVLAHQNEAAPALLRAVRDPDKARRRAAAYVLGRSSEAALQTAGRGLLTDGDPLTRLRAVQGLLAGGDRQAVPALIDLLTTPEEVACLAEDMLLRMAGEDLPLPEALFAAADRRKQRDAWTAWWREHGAKVDLAKVPVRRHLGLTIVTQADKIWEVDSDGRRRWELANAGRPIEAHALPGRRLLIAENDGNRLIECDLQGHIFWELKLGSSPVSCNRLPDGTTFVATNNTVALYSRTGRAIYSYNEAEMLSVGRLESAVRLRNGHVAIVDNRKLSELDPVSGKIVRSLDLPHLSACYSVEEVADGHLLLVSYGKNKVIEIDAKGEIVWTFDLPGAFHATRLPNGNTLVTSHSQGLIVEVTLQGKIVHEIKAEGRVWRSQQH